MTRRVRFLLGILLLSALSILANSAIAQTTYSFTDTANNARWNVPANWEDLTTPVDPAATSPGSALNGGATNDVVVIANQATSGNQNIRLQVDAGTIDALSVGGAPNGGANTNFQIRTNAANLNVTGLTTVGSGTFAGMIVLNLGSPSLTLNDIVSGGTAGSNAISILPNNATVTPTITILGDMDTAAIRTDGLDDYEVDLILNRTGGLVLGGTVPQTLNVESFQVLASGNAAGNAATHAVTHTLDGGDTINASGVQIGQVNNNNRNYSGTLNVVDSATLTTNGNTNGHIHVGRTSNVGGTTNDTAIADGTLNIGDAATPGFVVATGQLRVGRVDEDNLTSTQSATGTVTVNNAGTTVDVNTIVLGALPNIVGTMGTASGTMTVNDGATVNVGTSANPGSLFIAGDTSNSTETNTTGVFTLNDGTVTVTGGNTGVGQGGDGTLNVNGGNFNQVTNNLILGQTDFVPIPSVATGAQGTMNVTGGTVTVAGTALNANHGNISINRSGGDINQSGGTIDIENNLNLGDGNLSPDGVAPADMGQNSSLTVSAGVLNIGNNLDFRGGDAFDIAAFSGGDINIANNLDINGGMANTLAVIGVGSTIDVGNNLLANNADTTMLFDLVSGASPTSLVSVITVAGTANVSNATLDVQNLSGYTGAFGPGIEIPLVDTNGAVTGTYAGFPEGTPYGVDGNGNTWIVSYVGGADEFDIVLTSVIPEPDAFVLFGLAALGLLGFRKR